MEEVEDTEEVEAEVFASNSNRETAPLARTAGSNMRVAVVEVEATEVVVEVEATAAVEATAEAVAAMEVVDMEEAAVVAESASTSRKGPAHMVPTADSSMSKSYVIVINIFY